MISFHLIAAHPKHPEFDKKNPIIWCGYDNTNHVHVWKRGAEGMAEGIRFLRLEDALKSGVAGPNYWVGSQDVGVGVDCSRLPDLGVMVLHCEDNEQERPGE